MKNRIVPELERCLSAFEMLRELPNKEGNVGEWQRRVVFIAGDPTL